MEKRMNLHIEKLSEGYYLATSEDIQGLVAQGKTVSETIEIAKDIAEKLMETKETKNININLLDIKESFIFPLIINI